MSIFDGKGKRDVAYLESRFIAAILLSWRTASVGRERDESFFKQIIVTYKISG